MAEIMKIAYGGSSESKKRVWVQGSAEEVLYMSIPRGEINMPKIAG
jgi:hypothetical protein